MRDLHANQLILRHWLLSIAHQKQFLIYLLLFNSFNSLNQLTFSWLFHYIHKIFGTLFTYIQLVCDQKNLLSNSPITLLIRDWIQQPNWLRITSTMSRDRALLCVLYTILYRSLFFLLFPPFVLLSSHSEYRKEIQQLVSGAISNSHLI